MTFKMTSFKRPFLSREDRNTLLNFDVSKSLLFGDVFGDARANYRFSKRVLIKWLSLGRKNENLKSLPTRVKKLSWPLLGL